MDQVNQYPQELNVPVSNITIFSANRAPIDIAYNQKTGNRSKHIDTAYHLVCQNVQSGWIARHQVELAKRRAHIYTKGLS
jgi:hypothetical protein